MEKQYICIDLKSFFASCECIERNLNPFNTPLVVANKNVIGCQFHPEKSGNVGLNILKAFCEDI